MERTWLSYKDYIENDHYFLFKDKLNLLIKKKKKTLFGFRNNFFLFYM